MVVKKTPNKAINMYAIPVKILQVKICKNGRYIPLTNFSQGKGQDRREAPEQIAS